ncbi:mycothiol system anti-sigma-R factor [Kineococcus indalonis]|uniref:mycothiol system anti-sigma-R factor n=1 Tax=Kineococcus indalonis TaxID=2696566 RepID=UPI0014131191|nr:mycothiol system anti-sigma-R factor [Kineococcus indalonis]NAZ85770.1 mycothiol system anti-sigma-R factor [Kineococcus indalonis]
MTAPQEQQEQVQLAAAGEVALKQECREVLDRAFEYLDGEMAELDCERLKSHLAECAHCLEQLAEDEELKRAIRDGCPCETAPTQLRARILVQITEVTATVR